LAPRPHDIAWIKLMLDLAHDAQQRTSSAQRDLKVAI
jgi:hypothetical protein